MEKHPNKAGSGFSLKRGIQFAFRHPKESAAFLSKMLYSETQYHKKFSTKMRLSLASHLLGYIVNPDFGEFDRNVLEKMKLLPLQKAVKIAVRFPGKGMKLLAAITYEELAVGQRYSSSEIISFVGKFLGFALSQLKKLDTEDDDALPRSGGGEREQ